MENILDECQKEFFYTQHGGISKENLGRITERKSRECSKWILDLWFSDEIAGRLSEQKKSGSITIKNP